MAIDLADLAKNSLIGNLEKLRDEVRQLAEPLTDAELWHKPLDQSNSVGHLILHLSGNLNHFVGARLGNTGYVREREREFTEANVPSRATLLAGLECAVAAFRRVVSGLSADQLAAPHPDDRFGTVLNALTTLLAQDRKSVV